MIQCKTKYFYLLLENPSSIIFVTIKLNKYLKKIKDRGKEAIQEEAWRILFKFKTRNQSKTTFKIQNNHNKLKN